ncbi:Protein patched 1 [Liparis tanakae]|uniref:Protein patched 1 n=1 Tax=Liparis tanakae TaxID=230148 RepID=A0A4Z2E1X8_9TELE|nr:Protein patched 1 [Liparis tanakae]
MSFSLEKTVLFFLSDPKLLNGSVYIYIHIYILYTFSQSSWSSFFSSLSSLSSGSLSIPGWWFRVGLFLSFWALRYKKKEPCSPQLVQGVCELTHVSLSILNYFSSNSSSSVCSAPQAAIVVVFNFGMVLLIFPAILSLDLHRREDKRLDILCCLYSPCSDRVIHLSPHELSDAGEQPRAPPTPTATTTHTHQYSAGSTITTSTQITTTVQAFTQCDAAGQHIVTILPPTSQISTSPPSIILCPASPPQGKHGGEEISTIVALCVRGVL